MVSHKTILDLVKQYVDETAPIDTTVEQKKKMIDTQVIILLRV